MRNNSAIESGGDGISRVVSRDDGKRRRRTHRWTSSCPIATCVPEPGHPLRRLFVDIYTTHGESTCESLVNGELEPLDEKHPCRVEYVHRTLAPHFCQQRGILLSCPLHHFLPLKLRAHAFARSVNVVRSSAVHASSRRRRERRWAIVCGSPHSQSTNWASSR